PILYDINLVENKIIMEFIDGPTAKDVLDKGGPAAMKVARGIGQIIGRLHRAGIIHGDLTTSNIIVRDGRIVMIAFSPGGTVDGLRLVGPGLRRLLRRWRLMVGGRGWRRPGRVFLGRIQAARQCSHPEVAPRGEKRCGSGRDRVPAADGGRLRGLPRGMPRID